MSVQLLHKACCHEVVISKIFANSNIVFQDSSGWWERARGSQTQLFLDSRAFTYFSHRSVFTTKTLQ